MANVRGSYSKNKSGTYFDSDPTKSASTSTEHIVSPSEMG